MDETSYGMALKALARREGHMGMLPPSPPKVPRDPRADMIAALMRDGITTRQIGKFLGITHGRVSQIASRA